MLIFKEEAVSSLNTMLLIAETLVALTEHEAPEKISVSDIVAASGKNRKTFYYHFTDKNNLIAWLFRYDLGVLLRKRFREDQLVFQQDTTGKDPLARHPYYVFVKKGVRSLDHAAFFETFAECLEGRRSYYAKVLADNSRYSLREYLYQLYVPALENDVRFILSNRYLRDESVQFLAEFYTDAFLSYLTRQAMDLRKPTIGEGVGPFVNLIHTSLENEIKEQQLRRML